jgi:hypothetical protein
VRCGRQGIPVENARIEAFCGHNDRWSCWPASPADFAAMTEAGSFDVPALEGPVARSI